MNKINYILEDLIFESRRKDLINKYRKSYEEDFEKNGGIELRDRDYETFDSFVEAVEREIPHPRYLEFFLKHMCCDVSWDLGDSILNMLNTFHNLSNKGYIKNKDIYSSEYKPEGGLDKSKYRPDFKNLMLALDLGKKKEQEKELKVRLGKDRDVVYSDDRWVVVVPKSHSASCKYGAGTKWCTTQKNDDSYFKSYTEKGVLFYILDKNELPTLQSYGKVDDNVMYKIALTWGIDFDYDSNRFVGSSVYDDYYSKIYDSKDRELRASNILPLFPNEMTTEMSYYYDKIIKDKNKGLVKKENEVKFLLNDFQQKMVDEGLITKFMSKLEKDLPKEQVVKLNGGISELSTDPTTHTFWFALNDYTSIDSDDTDVDDDLNPVYSGFIFGTQSYTGREQFLEITLNNEDGAEMDSDELLMDKDGFGEIFGNSFIKDARGGFVSWEQWLEHLFTKKDEFFNVNPEIIVNILYKKVVNFIRDNSWKREWRGENSDKTYFTTSSGDVYWVPANCSSTFVFKYPAKEGSLTQNFINYVKENPGSTSKQFYRDVYNQQYFPGLNTALTPSLRDAGIVKTKKGTYGELKYYLGPNYKKWTQGKVHRYRLQCVPMKWKSK